MMEGLVNLGEDKFFLFFATFLLCFARMIGFFVQAPIFASNHLNRQIKLGLMTCFTIIMWPHVPVLNYLPGGFITFMLLLMNQMVVGMVIGYVAYIPMAIAQFGGEMMDIQMGLSSAAANDPSSKGTINLIRRLKFYLAMLFFMFLNGHHTLLIALARSYEIIPLTGINFTKDLTMDLIHISGQVLTVGIQIALPVMGALFMVQVALGIMARVAPQMNVFMLSFPLNILTGLIMIIVALPLYIQKLPFIFEQNFSDMYEAFKVMVPH